MEKALSTQDIQASLVIPARVGDLPSLHDMAKINAFLQAAYPDAFEILVVANGSLTKAIDTYPFSRVRILHIPTPGKGGALIYGLQNAEGSHLLTIDADLPFSLDFFLNAKQALMNGADFVTGNRRLDKSTFCIPTELLPFVYKRHRVGILFNTVVRLLFGVTTTDTQAGIKAMSRRMASAIAGRVICSGFLTDIEYFLICEQHQFRHCEFPVDFRLKSEKSTVHLLREFARTLLWLGKILTWDLRGKYRPLSPKREVWRHLMRAPQVKAGQWLFLVFRWGLTPFSEMARYLPESGRAMDFGCGHGLGSALFCLDRPHLHVLGVDHDEKRIQWAAKRWQNIPNLRFETKLPVPELEESVDAFIAIDVMHYLPPPEQDRQIESIYRHLKPGGRLLLRELDPLEGILGKLNRLYESFMVGRGLTKGKGVYSRNREGWVALLESKGFTVQSTPCRFPIFADWLFIASKSSIGPDKVSRSTAQWPWHITADDWGISPAVNDAIVELAKSGRIQAVSLLADGPFLSHRLHELKSIPTVELGLHLSLTYQGQNQVRRPVRGLIGLLLLTFSGNRKIHTHWVTEEMERQKAILSKHGISVRYCDGHQHVHVFPLVASVFAKTLNRWGIRQTRLPLNWRDWWGSKAIINLLALSAKSHFARNHLTYRPFYYPKNRVFTGTLPLRRALSDDKTGYEVIVHPAKTNDFAQHQVNDSYQAPRVAEYLALRDLTADSVLKSPSPWPHLEKAASSRFILASAFLIAIFHLLVFADVARIRNKSFGTVLSNWDSGWFTTIVDQGYGGINWAFFPLYPVLVKGLQATVLPLETPIVGLVLSLLCFMGFSAFVGSWSQRQPRSPGGSVVYPLTRMGWLLWLLTPASYVFQSHHSEALFLLLSWGVFALAATKHWYKAALLAGLCALTKNQGVLLAFSLGLYSAISAESHFIGQYSSLTGRSRRFVLSGMIAGALFILYPAYQYFSTGSFIKFIEVQRQWHPEITLSSWVKGFFLSNPWQNSNLGSLQNLGLFWLLLICGFVMARRGHFLAGIYVCMFTFLESFATELVGTRRYATVLFPALFFMGDKMASRFRSGWLVLILLILAVINLRAARCFAKGCWAY